MKQMPPFLSEIVYVFDHLSIHKYVYAYMYTYIYTCKHM